MNKPQVNHRSITIAIAALVIITGVVATTLALTVFSKPGQDDYKQTQTSVIDMRKKLRNYSNAYTAYFTDKQSAKNTTESNKKLSAALSSYNAQIKTIAEQKALKNKSIKTAYDAYVAKNKTAQLYFDSYYKDYDLYVKVSRSDCAELKFAKINPATLVDNYNALLKTCQSNINKLKSSKNQIFSLYAKTLDDFLQARRPLYVNNAKAALNPLTSEADYQATVTALRDSKFKDITSGINKIQADLSVLKNYDALKKSVDDALKTSTQ